MLANAHVVVSGTVQGIFYRSAIRSRAALLEITGWIRNLPDGRVEGMFEGERDDVDELIEFCRSGHPRAMVMEIDVDWQKPRGNLTEFEIR